MNRLRIISVLLALLLCAFALVSCDPGQTGGDTTAESTAADTPQVTPEETTPETPVNDLLTLEIYENGFDRTTLGEHSYFFDEIVNDMGEWVLVWKANVTLKDFKFLAMDESEELRVEETLYSLSELTPEKPLVVATYINDATINRGISFTDSEGNTVYYVIELSMNDGSYKLSKVEFDAEH